MADAFAAFFSQQVEAATAPLKARIEELEKTNGQLKEEVESLNETVEFCKGNNKMLLESNQKLTENLRLSEETAAFHKQMNTTLSDTVEELKTKTKATPTVSDGRIAGLKRKVFVAENRLKIADAHITKLADTVMKFGGNLFKEKNKFEKELAQGVFDEMFTEAITESEGEGKD